MSARCMTAVLSLFVAFAGGCSGDSPGANNNILPPAPVARIDLQPPAISIIAGGTQQLAATAYDAQGNVLGGRPISFSTSDAAVATVTSTGLVTGLAPGSANITASTEGRLAAAVVSVAESQLPVARLDVTPANASIVVGGSVQLSGVAYDAQGRVTTAAPFQWVTNSPQVATVNSSGLVVGVAPGSAQVTVSASGFVKSAAITVTSLPAGNVITVNPAVTFQTMNGWQAGGQNGWLECSPIAFNRYKTELHNRLINELGIERIHIPLRSGAENVVDYFTEFVAGRITEDAWNDSWFVPVNDNSNPFVADPSKFHWGFLDGYVDNAIIPLRQLMQARGEQLTWTLTYIDFLKGLPKPFQHMKSPDEYAEFVVVAFEHLRQKYGFVPDAFEMVLEPEHTPYTATDLGRSLVAVSARLRAAGFTPAILGPSTTSTANASTWYDGMMQVPGASGLLSELVYHRYVALSQPALSAIGMRSLRDGIKVSMLEHIGSGIDDLIEDVTVANASSWMQYSAAFCGNRDNPDNQGVYYQINQTDPNNPKINITDHSKLLRQIFFYVRRGAVRLGATSGNPNDLVPLAFRNANGKFAVVVRAKRGASFAVAGLPAGTYGINFGTTGNQWNVSLADQTIGSGGSVNATIPTDGVITIFGR